MATVAIPIEDWATLPWKQYERNVYRLQRRIYQAARRGDWKRVHSLQRLVLHSWSTRCWAVRRVTQENRGKRTPGVDGVASLTPSERLALARRLGNITNWRVAPIRRTYIPKPNNPSEKRGLGIPICPSHCTSYQWVWGFVSSVSAVHPGINTADDRRHIAIAERC